MSNPIEPSIVEHASAFGFNLTVERLAIAIEAAGMAIFSRIDHAKNAHEVGLIMPSTLLLIYGSPKVGTQIMLVQPQAALDLPLRVLVYENEKGDVVIAFHPAAAMLRDAGVPERLAIRLEPAQQVLVSAVQL